MNRGLYKFAIRYKLSEEIKIMKTDKNKKVNKKVNKKFDLEKMKVAKLENIHLINGGYALGFDDPIDTGNKNGDSSNRCGR